MGRMKPLFVGWMAALSLAILAQRVDAIVFTQVGDFTVDQAGPVEGILQLREAGGLGSVAASLPLTPFSSSDFENTLSFSSLGGGFADLTTGTLGARASIDATALSVTRRVDAVFEDTIIPAASGLMHFDFVLAGTVTGGALGRLRILSQPITDFLLGPDVDAVPTLFPGDFLSFDLPVIANVPLSFGMELRALAFGITGDADLLSTATVAISGIPFTSDSGVFLTGGLPAPSVAAPATLLLLGAGFGCLIVARRFYRHDALGTGRGGARV